MGHYSRIKSLYNSIVTIGINQDSSPLDISRSQIINLTSVTILATALFFFLYRLLSYNFFDYAVTNLVVLIVVIISLWFCSKGKHQVSAIIISGCLIGLVIDLSLRPAPDSDLITFNVTSIIYLSLLPCSLTMLFNDNKSRYLLYMACLIIFNFINLKTR